MHVVYHLLLRIITFCGISDSQEVYKESCALCFVIINKTLAVHLFICFLVKLKIMLLCFLLFMLLVLFRGFFYSVQAMEISPRFCFCVSLSNSEGIYFLIIQIYSNLSLVLQPCRAFLFRVSLGHDSRCVLLVSLRAIRCE